MSSAIIAGSRARASRVMRELPRGNTLPAAEWSDRHAVLLGVLFAHVLLLPFFGLIEGWSVVTSVLVLAPSAALGAAAAVPRLGRVARSCACALGLLSCSAALVVFWHGTIEAHFHYFVVTAALALYEDWTVYGLAIGYVILQHGLMSQVNGEAVFAHPMGMGDHSMWVWALIHGGFIAALAVANVVNWRAAETARRQAQDALAKVRHQAEHDHLTGLVNRRRFVADLQDALDEREQPDLVGVLFVDLDDFKLVNDSLGHEAGDHLLCAVARRLRDALRPGDVLGRFGGDEFVICLTAASCEAIERVGDRIGLALAAPMVFGGRERPITASVGIAMTGESADAETLVADADSAMYVAKSRGKARRQTYDSVLRVQVQDRRSSAPLAVAPVQPAEAVAAPEVGDAAAAAELQRLLAEGSIRAAYQPIVELATRTVVGYEALARTPADSSLANPENLFAAGRRHGRLAELDWACRAAAVRGAAELPSGTHLFINAEPEVLAASCPPHLRETWQRAGLHSPVIEVTERALAARPAELLEGIARMRRRGWRLALDDVGADVQSLALMPLLRPDVIKLDLRLIQQQTSADIAAIVNAVNAEHERTGATLLAEGIETEEHLATAVALGATVGQGWLFGRPGPAPGRTALPPRSALLPVIDDSPPQRSAYEAVAARRPSRCGDKRLLIAMSKNLERQAMELGSCAVIVGAFQDAKRFTRQTRVRYTALAQDAAFVAAVGAGMPERPAPGVRGAALPDDDPLRGEWSVAVVGPHFSAALVATDLGDRGPDLDRRFDFVLTYDRDLVLDAARALLGRIVPEGSVAAAGALLPAQATI